MGRLRPWHNLPPVLQCSKYRRLLDSNRNSSNGSNHNLSDDSGSSSDEAGDVSVMSGSGALSSGSNSVRKHKKCGSKRAKSGSKRSRRPDCSRQLIQDSFQELMSYSCGQCGHVQTMQAEELKSILGHAFRLAYAAHLQKAAGLHDYPPDAPLPPPSPPPHHQPPTTSLHHHHHSATSTFHHHRRRVSRSSTSPSQVSATSSPSSSLKDPLHVGYAPKDPLQVGYTPKDPLHVGYTPSRHSSGSSSCDSDRTGRLTHHTHTHTDQRPCDHGCTAASDSLSCSGPSGVGGMRTPACLPLHSAGGKTSHCCDSSPDSDTSNSPTHHNSSHKLHDKPSFSKHIPVPPLEDAPPVPTSFPLPHLVEPLHSTSCSNITNNNSTNNLNTGGVKGGYVNDGSRDRGGTPTGICSSGSVLAHNIVQCEEHNCNSSTTHAPDSTHCNLRSSTQPFSSPNHCTRSPLHHSSTHSQSPLQSTHSPLHSSHSQSPRHSFHSQSPHPSTHSSQSPLHSSQSPLHSSQSPLHSSQPCHSSGRCPSPPPLPERSDSLATPDEPHLRAAAWFQAGIPREIALEVLGQEPLGAFLVRESSSKPGCYALSLRVPADFAAAGIAHYLIVRTTRGYRIKGFTKEFPTLRTLITHHSVMPELLPVPLLLTRHNPAFQHHGKDSTEEDPDYNTLADFRKMMADLNV